MNFESFKSKVVNLDTKEKENVREKYIEKFINTNSDVYQEQIKTMREFKDGYCYQGYLWDCLINPTVVDENYFVQSCFTDKQVYVFWDIHSCERILIKDYWRFEKDAVLQMSMNILLENEMYLPEDIYIVDKDFSWTMVKTHEDIDGKRYCLVCGNP